MQHVKIIFSCFFFSLPVAKVFLHVLKYIRVFFKTFEGVGVVG